MSANVPAATAPGAAQPAAPYAVRAITITLNLGGGAGSIVLKGLRVTVHVDVANLPNTGQAQVRIYGMTLNQMNAASLAGGVYKVRVNKSTITIDAGDSVTGMATLFQGIIIEAFPDMRDMPNTAFFVLASPTSIAQLKSVTPTTYPGTATAAEVFGALAAKAGVTLENGGVKTVLQSPYYWGTAWSQILSALRAVDCFGFYDGVKNVLAIWPKTGNRSGGPVTISPATGMIGYPEFELSNIRVRCLFNPTLFSGEGPGHQIKVESELQAANGTFTIMSIAHDLASQMPSGPWETVIDAYPV
jgi:hypothetical protein